MRNNPPHIVVKEFAITPHRPDTPPIELRARFRPGAGIGAFAPRGAILGFAATLAHDLHPATTNQAIDGGANRATADSWVVALNVLIAQGDHGGGTGEPAPRNQRKKANGRGRVIQGFEQIGRNPEIVGIGGREPMRRAHGGGPTRWVGRWHMGIRSFATTALDTD